MKLSFILCASLVALAALALTAQGASAATTVNSSRSNSYKTINISDTKAVQACLDGDGTISKSKAGTPICTMPATETAAEATTVSASKSNYDNKTGATAKPAYGPH